jgi:hypothetical protein
MTFKIFGDRQKIKNQLLEVPFIQNDPGMR